MNVIEKIKSLKEGRKIYVHNGEFFLEMNLTTDDFHRLAEIVEVAEKALEKYADNSNWYWSEHEQKDCFDMVPAPQNAHDIADQALDHIRKLKGGSDGK